MNFNFYKSLRSAIQNQYIWKTNKINLSSFEQEMPEKKDKSTEKNQTRSPQKKESKKTQKKSSTKLTPEQIQELQSQKIKQFFSMQLEKTSKNINISPVNQEIIDDIIKGEIKVSEESKNLSSLIKPPVDENAVKITPQQMEMYQKQARRIQHLKMLSNLNKQLRNKEPEESISYILTKQQHQRRVRQFIEQKRLRDKKLQQIKKKIQQKIQKEEKQAIQKAKIQRSYQKQKKRMEIQDKITKQKQQHIHFLSSDIKHRQDLQQVMNKVPLHIKMQQNFVKSIQIPQLQQKKRQYKNLRQFKQKYSVDQIREFQKEYISQHKKTIEQSKIKRFSSVTLRTQGNSKSPEKPQRLKSILAEQIHNFKRQWTQRDLYVEQKLKREQNYLKKLKDEHKPKVDEEKRQQMEKRLIKQKQHLGRIGLNIDRKKVGLEYLGEIKKLAKKKKQEVQNSQNSDQMNLKQHYKSQILNSLKRSASQGNTFEAGNNTQIVERLREKKLSKILNSEQSADQKLEKLKIQSQKIQSAKQRKLVHLKHNFDQIASKEASNLALNSIKTKINLIELMRKQ